MTALQVKTAMTRKRAAIKKITDSLMDPAGEIRAMTDDEKKSLKEMKAALEEMGSVLESMAADEVPDDEDDDEEDKPPPETKSRRKSAPLEPGHAPAIHTKKHAFSILRATRCVIAQRQVDGLEGECNRELEKLYDKPAKGFYMPMGNEVELRDLLKHTYSPQGWERRGDLTTITGTGSIFVAPMLPFIELLRNKTVCQPLGVTFLTSMDGKFSIPRQNLSPAAAWIAEGNSLTANNQTLDQVAFVNKTLGGATLITRKFASQTSINAETFVQQDLAAQLAIALDYAVINGSGTGAIPVGIMQNSTVIANSVPVQGGAAGAAPTFGQMVAMESQVANANADRGRLAYLTSPSARGKLKTSAKIGSTFPVFIWENDEINGYPALASTQVPNNLVKGATTNCSAIIFGNWEDAVLAQWGGFDVVVNPYSNQLAGGVQISMMTEADVQLRHPESFSIATDLITT